MNAIYGRRIVKKLGGDPSPIRIGWCWREFGEQYPELLEKAMEYFKGRKNNEAAYYLVHDCGAPVEWALGVEARERGKE